MASKGDMAWYVPHIDYAWDIVQTPKGPDYAYRFALKGTELSYSEVSRKLKSGTHRGQFTPLGPTVLWEAEILELHGDNATLSVFPPSRGIIYGYQNVPHDSKGRIPHSWHEKKQPEPVFETPPVREESGLESEDLN